MLQDHKLIFICCKFHSTCVDIFEKIIAQLTSMSGTIYRSWYKYGYMEDKVSIWIRYLETLRGQIRYGLNPNIIITDHEITYDLANNLRQIDCKIIYTHELDRLLIK